MKAYVREPVETPVLSTVTCDVCKTVIDLRGNDMTAYMEAQEVETFRFTAGYGSRYNDDGVSYAIDICQDCIRSMLGPYLRSTADPFGVGTTVTDSL